MRVSSFDIFDTVLIRRCGRPENLWRLMALRLWPEDEATRDAFVVWRARADRRAGSLASLTDIYASAGAGAFAPYDAEHLMNEELDEEARELVAVPAVSRLIGERRAQGDTIMFVSDMYLPSEFLAGILRREGCLDGDERVVVSCEAGARKDDGGRLFAVASSGRLAHWTHHGDNRYSDVRMARRQGLHARHVNTSFTSVEKHWLRRASEMRCGWQLSVLAGMSRAARLTAGDTPVVRFAADFVAPAYIPYVKWVIDESRRRGISRLYFLSRDSYILYRIAEQLPHDGLELRYLFVSRKALTAPFLCDGNGDDFLAIVDRHTLIGREPGKLLDQLGFDREILEQRYGITLPRRRICSAAEQQAFLDGIFANEPFMADFRREASSSRDLLAAYFRQEKLLDPGLTAMVDVGWLGTSRLMINRLLTAMGGNATEFFYMGVRPDVMSPECGGYLSYNHPGQLDTMATALIENYLSASPYPSTLGYARCDDGRIKPVFAGEEVFEETSVTRANVDVAVDIAGMIAGMMGEADSGVMYEWSRSAIAAVASAEYDDIDYSPLLEAGQFDGVATAKRLTPADLLKLVALGEHITVFDRGSLSLTAGHRIGRLLWRLHGLSSRLRTVLYRRYVATRGSH